MPWLVVLVPYVWPLRETIAAAVMHKCSELLYIGIAARRIALVFLHKSSEEHVMSNAVLLHVLFTHCFAHEAMFSLQWAYSSDCTVSNTTQAATITAATAHTLLLCELLYGQCRGLNVSNGT
jgi:hypothetical protein